MRNGGTLPCLISVAPAISSQETGVCRVRPNSSCSFELFSTYSSQADVCRQIGDGILLARLRRRAPSDAAALSLLLRDSRLGRLLRRRRRRRPLPSRATPRASSTTASTSSTAKVCIHSATRNLYGGWVAVAVIGGQRASSPPMLRGRSPICSCPVGRTDRRPSSKGSPYLVLPPCYLLVLLRPLLEAGTSKSTWLTSSARRRTSSTSGWVATCQVSSACTCTTSSLASCPTSTRYGG